MKQKIRVLLAEDNPEDAELVLRELRQAGFEPEADRVWSEADFLARLTPELDIILSDHQMPSFTGTRALELVRGRGLDVPFIIISGTIGEEVAVEAMRRGATDYFLTDRLARLGASVQLALEQSELRAERKRVVSELQLFRALVDQSNDTFEVIDPATGRFLDVNERGCLGLGCTRAEYLALRVMDIDPQMTPAAWTQFVEGIRVTGSHYGERTHRRRDGSVFPIEYNAKLVRLDREYIVSVLRDVTDRQQAEERVREQAAMLDLAHDAIFVRDFHDRKIRYWNRGAETLYGWTAAEAMGRDVSELICSDADDRAQIQDEIVARGEWRGETRHRTKSGGELIVNTRRTLLRDAAGTPTSVLSINTDITEQKKLEAQMLRAQRLESIGTLAAGVAHDLNNILAPIMMSVPMLRGNLDPNIREALVATIEKSAARGAQIVRQVLAFGRGVEGARTIVPIDELLAELQQLIGETFPRNITVEISSGDALWPVTGDATQLHQVLMNLAVNARDAMPDGGTLRIRAENLFVDESYASMLPQAKVGACVRIEVGDTGSGIAPEILERIFDPFFTTKEMGKGTGLGLSTAFGIVRSHDGFLSATSTVGKGSRFQIFLPASPPEGTGSERAQASAPLPAGRGEVVLVVDDEETVLHAAEHVLRNHGYEVLLAADGVQALALFALNPGRVTLVITDLMMPKMDGVALIRALLKIRPELPIVATTGLGDGARSGEIEALGLTTILDKPFGADTMLAAVHHALRT